MWKNSRDELPPLDKKLLVKFNNSDQLNIVTMRYTFEHEGHSFDHLSVQKLK